VGSERKTLRKKDTDRETNIYIGEKEWGRKNCEWKRVRQIERERETERNRNIERESKKEWEREIVRGTNKTNWTPAEG